MSAVVTYVTDLERRIVAAEFKLNGYITMTESLMKRVNALEAAAARQRNAQPAAHSIAAGVPHFRLDYWATNLRGDA